MVDALAMVTGVAMVSFLLFYLAFSLEKIHIFLKLLAVVAGVGILFFIPQIIIESDKDCAILTNGSYLCYSSNGTQLTDLGKQKNIGTNLITSYGLFMVIFMTYLFLFYMWFLLKFLMEKIGNFRMRNRRRGG